MENQEIPMEIKQDEDYYPTAEALYAGLKRVGLLSDSNSLADEA